MSKAENTSTVAQVADRLAMNIVGGQYGEILPPQEELALNFGVSRTLMREALSMLLVKGMLEMRPRLGTRILPERDWKIFNKDVIDWCFAATPDQEFLRDLLDLRAVIEPRAAALAAERATPAEKAALRAAINGMHAWPSTSREFSAHDLDLHVGIIRASHNQLFIQLEIIVRASIATMIQIVSPNPGITLAAVNAHERVVKAIEAGDPVEADAAMRALVDRAANNIEERLGIDVQRWDPEAAHAARQIPQDN
ncbi:FadR/GntR family transcriptional regulator [Pararobbsia silviterrae]|nr:FCD domain-containing protein [Pararobbsia silviterrae]